MSLALHIQLLGGFRLISNTTPLTTFDVPRLQALLAYLVLHRAAPRPARSTSACDTQKRHRRGPATVPCRWHRASCITCPVR